MSDATLRVLIADDERPARNRLRRCLAAEPDIGPIHEAWDGPTTLEVIRDAAPDIVFLDITMPGISGIDIAESLAHEAAPHIIFVTAHEEYAIRAFDTAAVDYLLKPVGEERLRRALDRARTALARQRSDDELARLARIVRELGAPDAARLDRILAEDGSRRVLIDVQDVIRIEAARNHVLLHTEQGVHRARAGISDLERRLEPRRFARVGRSTIVNLARVRSLEPAGHGDYIVLLQDESRVRLSRRFVPVVAGRLGI